MAAVAVMLPLVLKARVPLVQVIGLAIRILPAVLPGVLMVRLL